MQLYLVGFIVEQTPAVSVNIQVKADNKENAVSLARRILRYVKFSNLAIDHCDYLEG